MHTVQNSEKLYPKLEYEFITIVLNRFGSDLIANLLFLSTGLGVIDPISYSQGERRPAREVEISSLLLKDARRFAHIGG